MFTVKSGLIIYIITDEQWEYCQCILFIILVWGFYHGKKSLGFQLLGLVRKNMNNLEFIWKMSIIHQIHQSAT